jgi:hypothetical protein
LSSQRVRRFPSRIDVEHLRAPSASHDKPRLPATPPRLVTHEQLVRREELCAVLKQHGRNISAVARHFGKERIQIRRWTKWLDISFEDITGRHLCPWTCFRSDLDISNIDKLPH